MFVDFSGGRGELPPPRYGCRRLLASPRGIKLSIRSCRSVSFHFTQTFLEKVLVVSNHAMLKSFVQRKKQSLPEVRMHVRIVNRSMDPEVLTAKGRLPHDEACRSLRDVDSFRVDSQLHSQAASETHVALFRPRWKRKPFLSFVFRIWSRRMFIWSQ